MNEPTAIELDLQFSMLSDMEKVLWAATMARHVDDADGGVAAANAQIGRLRELEVTRDHRLEPEYEAAKAGVDMGPSEFAGWYPIQHRLHHRYDRVGYVAPTAEQVLEAYERYARSRSDFW